MGWGSLLHQGIAEQYDWVINTELDHFLSPERARARIRKMKPSEGHPLMLMWGNAFVFNRAMVKQMRREWSKLGIGANPSNGEDEKIANGCPAWMKGKMEWPIHCSQDIVYL